MLSPVEVVSVGPLTCELHVDCDAGDPRETWDAAALSREVVAAYEAGEVFGWVVRHGGAVIDSCWGYYGETVYPMDEARDAARYELGLMREWAERDVVTVA